MKALRKTGAYMKGDARILGEGDFVEKMLRQAEEDLERKYRLAADGYDFNMVLERVAHLMDIKCKDVLSHRASIKKSCRLVASYAIGLCVSWVSVKVFWLKNLKSVNLQ